MYQLDLVMSSRPDLTPADLVVLSVLAEGPRHGNELSAELERRDVREWANVSRPQVYYSLRKLAERALIVPTSAPGNRRGPERTVYTLTLEGRAALSVALGRTEWAVARVPQPFMTWLAMAHLTDEASRQRVIEQRSGVLDATLAHERAMLRVIRANVANVEAMIPAAVLMVELTVDQLELERAWLVRVKGLLGEYQEHSD